VTHFEFQRRLYAALDNETPKMIAEKFVLTLASLLKDNKQLHPKLGRHSKLFPRTAIVLPLTADEAAQVRG